MLNCFEERVIPAYSLLMVEANHTAQKVVCLCNLTLKDSETSRRTGVGVAAADTRVRPKMHNLKPDNVNINPF